ncbi:MAG: dihydrofolate reductase [Eggerthellaceae bacterium]|nr:dihydrofolate reductase [Eggerthellaceae bacterium]
MRDITLFIAMSVDGFIADERGGVDWLSGHDLEGSGSDSYEGFIAGIDTVVMGWSTYYQIVTELAPGEWPYEGLSCYVITHRDEPSMQGVQFTSEDPVHLVQRLRCEEGNGIWICGGASVAQQLMRADLVDWFHLSMIPTILGSGIPLFGAEGCRLDLRLVRTQACNGIVEIVYERR